MKASNKGPFKYKPDLFTELYWLLMDENEWNTRFSIVYFYKKYLSSECVDFYTFTKKKITALESNSCILYYDPHILFVTFIFLLRK